MQVKWIKPLDGMGGQSTIGAPARAERPMREMALDLGGTDDLLAIYVTTQCKEPQYQGRICGFVSLPVITPDEDLGGLSPNHNWNKPKQWGVGCRVNQPWKGLPSKFLSMVDSLAVTACGREDWQKMRYSFRSGAPRRIDTGEYAALGASLTAFVNKNFASLIDLPDQGHAGVSPGQHRRN